MSAPLIDRAESAIARIREAAATLGEARAYEMALEDERPLIKSAAVQRLVGSPNPENGKPHSASSAKDVVETDPDYVAHRQRQRDAVIACQTAYAEYEASKLTARLAVACVEVGA